MLLPLRLFGHNAFAHGPPSRRHFHRLTRVAACALLTALIAGPGALPAKAALNFEAGVALASHRLAPVPAAVASGGFAAALGLPTAVDRSALVQLAQAEPPTGNLLAGMLNDFPIDLEALGLDGLDISGIGGLCAPSPFFLAFVVNEDMSAVCAAAERLVAVAGGIDGPTGAVPGALGRGFFGGLTGGPSPFQVAFSALGGPAGIINKFKYAGSSFRVNQGPAAGNFQRRGGSNTVVTQTVIVVPVGEAGTGAIGLLVAGSLLLLARRARRA